MAGDQPSRSISGFSGLSDDFGLADEPGEDAAPPLPPGTDLGGVTIVRLLADGGMGRVYEARQAAPPRPVAVKVVRQRLPSPQALARFEYEAAVLARLRHPHIAQIHTAGGFATALGRVPYLVMELIEDARPITRHAADRGLSVRERVALLRTVCAAVAHAHARGVLHRDLKPANVLVGGDGVAKVIDFGVARPTQPEAARDLTAGDALVGTLAYMSPEQIRGDADAIDTRSDVYALGLVLHEVVTGALPYDLRGLAPVAAAAVLDARTAGPATAVEAAVRREGRLPRAAAGGLSLIVGRCLERRPPDRYASAEELEADVGLWLAGEPLHVRPPTAAESLRRFARRHRLATAVAATAAGIGAVAVLGIAGFALRAERQRAIASALAAESRSRLAAADLLLAGQARDRDNVAEAARLLDEARALLPDPTGPEPIEMACLAASLDESLAVVARHTAPTTAVAWSPDGRTVATGHGDGMLQVVAAPEADGHTRGPAGWRCRGHDDTVWSVAFAPAGDLVVSCSEDGALRLWDARDGAAVRTLADHRGGCYGGVFAPAGDRVACGCRDGTARIYDVASGAECGAVTGHAGTVLAVRFSPDGRTLATGGRDGTVRLWDARTGVLQETLRGHAGRVFGLAFAPDGGRLASASEDGTVRLWDLADGTEPRVLTHPARVNAVAFCGTGGDVVSAAHDAVLRVWDAATGLGHGRYRGHVGRLWAVAAGPGGMVVTGSEDGTARAWDLAADAGDRRALGGTIKSIAAAADGGLVAVGLATGAVVLRDQRTLADRGRLATGSGVNGVALTRDASLVAAGCDDGGVHLWRPGGADGRRLAPHARAVFSVALSADAGRVLTASEDRTARLTSVATGEPAAPPLRHPNRVFCAAFAPGDELVATACGDRMVRLWRAADATLVRSFTGHTGQVNWVCFAPDGRRLASAASDATVRLWDLDGGAVSVLAGPARQLWKLAFAPDGSRLAAAAADGDVHLWDVPGGRATPPLRGSGDDCWAVVFAPDGRSLTSGGRDGLLRVWGVPRAEFARRRSAAARDTD